MNNATPGFFVDYQDGSLGTLRGYALESSSSSQVHSGQLNNAVFPCSLLFFPKITTFDEDFRHLLLLSLTQAM